MRVDRAEPQAASTTSPQLHGDEYVPDMKIMLCGLASGAGFGAATSLVNALSSPYSPLGAPLTGTVWGGAAKVLSLLMDAGWAWAALAVAMGWLAGAWVRGAVVGALALMAATVAYVWTAAVIGAGWAVRRFRATRRAVVA
jgi:hypothetical protein